LFTKFGAACMRKTRGMASVSIPSTRPISGHPIGLEKNLLKAQGDVEEGRKALDSLHPIGLWRPGRYRLTGSLLASDESKFMTGSELSNRWVG